MRCGSQSNQAPGLPVSSWAYPAALPAGSSAACFRPAAATKIPVSHRFPEPRRSPAHLGLSIPAPNQKKPRTARSRYPGRPAVLRARRQTTGASICRIRSAAKIKPRSKVTTTSSRRPSHSRETSFPRAATRAAMRAAEYAPPFPLLKVVPR